ncbi:3-oxoacyl-ACP synthase [Prauserella marina]|uniref:3-oxoacyl-[acyl-carrier-protein] synthase-3 n=1 Tax=Prauserella marina TaxID=530584 RepID=A0A222VS93_9PSEU|nr:ketoacyl-ACP synthase III [Prauserella marina]ASR36815.1 3-oxoacyl-ACP synthase [Prauserella marina]PWV80276.1 3-oxoacyl-[acyl-carrier-protein] synthase-3 [Prauserella marina]SDD50808.1 3-oxoacyl-[acyl-carrier-protein] synthase-3 [Prauserella marina]
MSPTAPAHVVLAGVGHDFPGQPVGNDFFETEHPGLGVDDAWIRAHTGVGSRHWARPGEHHVDLAERAAAMALKDAGLDASDVDVIVGTSATARPRVNPTTAGNRYMDLALPLQSRLGVRNAFAFDVTGVACAGFLHGSVVAQGLLAQPGVETVLVVCAEDPRPILNFGYRNATLFGGGAAAGVWRRTSGAAGLECAVLRADGEHYEAFDIDDDDKMIMKGKVVGDLAPRCLEEVTREVLLRNGSSLDDIDWIIPHQGNIHIIQDVGTLLDLRPERVLVNIDRRGNTSSVSVPGCLSEYVHRGVIRRGQRILAMSIGRGFSWGSMIFHYGAPLS